VAGTHTTSATATLLFWNLLHCPEYLAQCVKEVDTNLDRLSDEQPAYSVTQVETSLPLLRKCIKENFRITPVFTLPLERRITAPEGITISGRHIKQGVSVILCLICNNNTLSWSIFLRSLFPSRPFFLSFCLRRVSNFSSSYSDSRRGLQSCVPP
jgi:cytochrome P450